MMDSAQRDVLIIGASTRAAVQSAARAGWRAWTVDLFGDDDLRESAFRCETVPNYRELASRIADWPLMPWLYTGALENHPALLRHLARERELWGCSADVVEAVRNPLRLAETLQQAGWPALQVWTEDGLPPADGAWMLKPRKSAAGRGVVIWDEDLHPASRLHATLLEPHVFQERALGDPVSAVFLAEKNGVRLIGISRQIIGQLNAPPFGYCGSIGPVRLPTNQERRIAELGRLLGRQFQLRGLFGVDFVRDESAVWVTEVNPRYTASAELYELAYQIPLLEWHRQACESFHDEKPGIFEKPGFWDEQSPCVGKLILYTDRDLPIPKWNEWKTAGDPGHPERPWLADRPREGTIIPRGHPVCTVFGFGSSEVECRAVLNERARQLSRHFQSAGIEILWSF